VHPVGRHHAQGGVRHRVARRGDADDEGAVATARWWRPAIAWHRRGVLAVVAIATAGRLAVGDEHDEAGFGVVSVFR